MEEVGNVWDYLGNNHADSFQEDAENAVEQLLKIESEEIQGSDAGILKNHPLPLTRIKKIMRADEDVRMISSEAPALLSRASELFIMEITRKAWARSQGYRRRTLHRDDIGELVARTPLYDFLLDVVPMIT